MPTSKASAEEWFNANIKGEMEKLGHKTFDWVKGDRFSSTDLARDVRGRLRRGAASTSRRSPGRSSSSRRKGRTTPESVLPARLVGQRWADAIELLKAHAYGNDFLVMWRPAHSARGAAAL